MYYLTGYNDEYLVIDTSSYHENRYRTVVTRSEGELKPFEKYIAFDSLEDAEESLAEIIDALDLDSETKFDDISDRLRKIFRKREKKACGKIREMMRRYNCSREDLRLAMLDGEFLSRFEPDLTKEQVEEIFEELLTSKISTVGGDI